MILVNDLKKVIIVVKVVILQAWFNAQPEIQILNVIQHTLLAYFHI